MLALPRPVPRPPQNNTIVRLDAPQTVSTTDSRLCVHTRLTDEVEEIKIQKTLRLVREMGASTIVEFFPWAYVEREEGNYNWSHPDRILKHAENQGITVIARLGIVPQWARTGGGENTTLNYLPAENYPAFAKFVGKFTARYQDQVQFIIIWNEPNLNFEWGGRFADPRSYPELLKQAYIAAHEANPDIIVLNGALAPTLAPPGGDHGGWNDIDYLREMYEAGAGNYFDAVAVHSYGFTYPPQADPAPDLLNFRRIELLHEVMVEYGDGNKSVYLTETGWNDHPRWAHAVRPLQRINYTLEMYEYTRTAYPWLQSLCLWAFRYPAPTNSYPDYFTYVTPNFNLKPIYLALQNYGRGWEELQ